MPIESQHITFSKEEIQEKIGKECKFIKIVFVKPDEIYQNIEARIVTEVSREYLEEQEKQKEAHRKKRALKIVENKQRELEAERKAKIKAKKKAESDRKKKIAKQRKRGY